MILEYDIPDYRPQIFKTSNYRAHPYTVHNSFPPKSTLNGGSTVSTIVQCRPPIYNETTTTIRGYKVIKL